MKVCSIDGCERKHDAKGFCHVHYNRWKRRGDPLAPLLLAEDGSGWTDRKGYKILPGEARTREHVAISEKALGHSLPSGAVIHHVDENPGNNANSNLVICPSVKYHKLLHVRLNAMKACGNQNWRKCPYCGCYDDPQNMRGEKSGRFVHRECSARARNIAYARRKQSA